jgi:nicotinate-nucleotide pyrophosphorylase (carboxylating)
MSVADEQGVARLIEMAREEDLGPGDLTTNLLANPNERGTFRVIAKEPCVFAGGEIAPAVLAAYDKSIRIEWAELGRDGAVIESVPVELAVIRGPVGSVLSAERVLLNFLQRLSGIATLTRRCVDAVAGTGAKVLDTRKTTPGWRHLEKYAVRCGGGHNHRRGLYDALLIKDNHFAGVPTEHLGGVILQMLNALSRSDRRPEFVEVEADNLAQVEEILKVVGVDVILLDNFSLDDLRDAVALRDGRGLWGKIELEASGGINLQTIRAVAETGVDRISVGAITHSATAVDLSMERD